MSETITIMRGTRMCRSGFTVTMSVDLDIWKIVAEKCCQTHQLRTVRNVARDLASLQSLCKSLMTCRALPGLRPLSYAKSNAKTATKQSHLRLHSSNDLCQLTLLWGKKCFSRQQPLIQRSLQSSFKYKGTNLPQYSLSMSKITTI